MYRHKPACPSAEATDREAATVVSSHPDQGWCRFCATAWCSSTTPARSFPTGRSSPLVE